MTKIQRIGKASLCLAALLLAWDLGAQEADSTRKNIHFGGSVSVTNNGFSFVPTFSLGDPATIVELSVGRRFRFEPQFRYALAGRPWSFVFIWRYDLLRRGRFKFTVGTHLPALNFTTVDVIKDGKMEEVIQVRRFFPVWELIPSYRFTDDLQVRLYYLYGQGAKELTTRHSHFLSLQTDINHIRLAGPFYLRLTPQFYYLKQDEEHGVYVAGGVTLARRDFPFSIGSLFNKSISTDIEDTDFDWNISLIWSFGSEYKKL